MYTYKVNLVKVVDGDTVDVDIDLGFDVILKDQRVRLYGIDTPECRTRDLVEKQFGLLAKQKVEDLLAEGDITLVCKEYNSKGKFGRIIGELICDGININDYMIENHYAASYFGDSKEEIEANHLLNREILIKEGVITLD